jgi:hypothetical protein
MKYLDNEPFIGSMLDHGTHQYSMKGTHYSLSIGIFNPHEEEGLTQSVVLRLKVVWGSCSMVVMTATQLITHTSPLNIMQEVTQHTATHTHIFNNQ